MTFTKIRWLASTSLALAATVGPSALRAQISGDTAYVRAHYTKIEQRIPMRDGVELFTTVFVPRDTSRRYAMILTRRPYSVAPYGPDRYPRFLGPAVGFERRPFIYVAQDVRGRYLSEGTFVNMTPHLDHKRGPSDIDESTDTWDTIDWLVKHVPHNDGRVALWGISYNGFFAAAGMIDAHPALVAASPQAPQADWFAGDDLHHHGAFLVASGFNFFSFFGHPRPAPTTRSGGGFEFPSPDGYRFFLDLGPLANADAKYFKGGIPFWNELMDHGTYDAFWKARSIVPHLKNIRPAVMTVGGWYDSNNLAGALAVHRRVGETTPGGSNVLVVGPWSHGQWAYDAGTSLGDVSFGTATGAFFRDSIEAPFFTSRLEGRDPGLPAAYVFETGGDRWRTFDAWPPKGVTPRSLYLGPDGGLGFAPPTTTGGSDQYVSDPARPVPYIEGLATDMTIDYQIQDQRFASRRPDVLVYQTAPLAEDLTIAGPIRPSLWVSTSGTDADWVVKLIDVYPDDAPERAASTGTGPLRPGDPMGGYQELVRGDVMRGKFRESLEKPVPFQPGRVTKVEFSMLDVLHTFRKGHRIMVQIQSSWFPLIDRNPQTFVDIYHAKASDFKAATERVYRTPAAPSRIEIGVLP